MFCHFRISIAGSPPKTVVFQLQPDICPKTCDNFIALCQSSATAKRPSSSAPSTHVDNNNVQPTYRGTDFHRILPTFMIQGGDFTKFDGTGGHAHPTTNSGQPTFPDENFTISHDREGTLSMANRGKNTNGSQFFITLGKTLHLDGKHVAFGHVVRGVEVVRDIAKVETEGDNGRPVMMQRVRIVDCGLGTGDDDDSEDSSGGSSSSSSSSSLNEKRKRSKKSKHRRKDDDDDSYHKKRKRSRDRSSHSKHRKRQHDKDDYKRKKSKDKSSHRQRRKDDSSASEEDEGHRHSSKKRHKHDRRSDDKHHRKKKSDRR